MITGPPEEAQAGPPAGRAALARRLRAELGPPPELDDWPPVSIVVVNRDGAEHLRLLLPRLASATDYPRLELVLVDNASQDGSVETARSADLPFPLTIVENDSNLSFSDANDDGFERATFDRVLFLNNDIEPFEPGWLKELVACLERGGAAAAGATLLHGSRYGDRSGSGYVLQHTGIELVREAGQVVPANSSDGSELRDAGFEARVPASTAACLLVRREAFARVGGFTPGFVWGWEDVDLGLKLTMAGDRVLCSGRCVLFHDESSTRALESHDWQRRTRAGNQRTFAQRWGPQVRREYLLDRISGDGFWTDSSPPRLAIAVPDDPVWQAPARELADAVESEGWRVTAMLPSGDGWSAMPRDADFVLISDPSVGAALPSGVGTIAWVHEPSDDWLSAPLLHGAELVLAAHPGVCGELEAAGIAAVPFAGAANADRPRSGAPAAADIDCLVVSDRDQLTPDSVLALGDSQELRMAAVGAGWERWPGPFEALGEIPWESLPVVCARARIVIWERAAASRAGGPSDAACLLEAALAGALPLTDDAELVAAVLGGAELPTWSSAEELAELARGFLADEPRRRALVERCASVALEAHTWRHRGRRLTALLSERSQRLRFCLKLPRTWEAEPVARSLRRSLEARGHACAVQLADEWELLDGMTADVAVVLGDPGPYCTTPAQLNVLWAPEPPRPSACDQWDLVLVADEAAAAALAAETPTAIAALDLRSATDPGDGLLAHVAEAASREGVTARVPVP